MNKTRIIEHIERTIMTTIGIGSSSSLTKGAPTVAHFDTRTTMLIAVAFLEKGNILSS